MPPCTFILALRSWSRLRLSESFMSKFNDIQLNIIGCRAVHLDIVRKGPSINDVTQIFGFLDPPPPPCHAFLADHKSKSTQPPLLHHVLDNPPPPLSSVTSFMDGPLEEVSLRATTRVFMLISLCSYLLLSLS